MNAIHHTPVLLHEVLELLAPREGEFFVDGTLDGGGHAREVIRLLMKRGSFLGIDLDHEMVEKFSEDASSFASVGVRIFLECGNFASLPEILERHKLPRIDGLLLDLGFSSLQLGSDERPGIGLSFLKDEPLRMTYSLTAQPLHERLKEISKEELARIIFEYSGERYAEAIAKEIIKSLPIVTTFELVRAIERAIPRGYERGRIHKATRTFQALRIFVNDELKSLQDLLLVLSSVMASGGRVAIITFHSLEDRLVKQAFRSLEREEKGLLMTKKPITPTLSELHANPRSRSAKLRGITFL